MDRVLTLDNWWNGPLLGLCTFDGGYCVFERIFSQERDDWSDEYWLTPVNEAAARSILANRRNWCAFMSGGGDARNWKNEIDICGIAKLSLRYREYQKRGAFKGKRPENLYSEISELFVIWE